MTNTIPNVPRELLERAWRALANSATGREIGAYLDADPCAPECAETCARASMCATCSADLSAPSPAGVDGLEVVGWYTEDHLYDKSATTYSWTVAERWVEKGWPVSPLYAAPVSEAKAQVVMPERKTKADYGVYIDEFADEAAAIYNAALDEVARLNAAHVQRVSVPASAFASRAITHYEAALLAAFPSGSSGEVFNQWNEARRVLSAAPAAPAADAGHVFYGMDGNHP